MGPNDVRDDGGPATLDRTDVAIIRTLQDDARITNKDLAARVSLSPSACLERVRRLLARGVIRGYHAAVDPAAVGIGLEVLLMVRLQRHTRTTIEAFQSHCDGLEEVIHWWHLTGDADYVLHLAVRDHEHLRAFLMDSFTTRPEIAHLATHVALARNDEPRWPLWPASAG
jgi:DNA-binding Lrp family transcriptional regulator